MIPCADEAVIASGSAALCTRGIAHLPPWQGTGHALGKPGLGVGPVIVIELAVAIKPALSMPDPQG